MSNKKEITNINDVKTFGFIISLDEVTKNKSLLKDCKSANNTNTYSNNVFVNARTFDYNDLQCWLHYNLGLSVDYILQLKPVKYETKVNKILIDLTTVTSRMNRFTFIDKVDEMRKRLDNVIKQTVLFKPYVKDYVKPIMNNDKLDSLTVEFTATKLVNNKRVTEIINCTEEIPNENSKQASIRKAFANSNYKGILFNTGYLVPVNDSNADLFFASETLSKEQLIKSGLGYLPYYKGTPLNSENYVTLLDVFYNL